MPVHTIRSLLDSCAIPSLPSLNMSNVIGFLTLTCDFCVACALSIAFPTADTLKCDVGNSHPAYSLWKYLIAARYPLIVPLWFLYKRHLEAMNTVNSLTALSTPCASNSHGPRPAQALSSVHVLNMLQYRLFVFSFRDPWTSRSTSRSPSTLVPPAPCSSLVPGTWHMCYLRCQCHMYPVRSIVS